ncbi:MAG: ergosterol biosynthesis protein, partial [Icmadophila ericetorum]|nr:ergosterol biosynthesis protein [Icmadophila ericetorum]
FFNGIQTYTTLAPTKRVYSGTPPPATSNSSAPSSSSSSTYVNPLSARTFGTWTFLSSVIRFYAAYNISNPLMYQLAMWSYGIAFGHFFSEWLVYRTARWGAGLAGPVIVSTASLVWMLAQWGFYVT